MQYLHGQSPAIVHRDLKTHNLLIDYGGRIKVCDFGLVSTRSKCAGTPNYMAPELLRSGTSFSKKVDVYAFGILLWEVSPARGRRRRREHGHGSKLIVPALPTTLRCSRDASRSTGRSRTTSSER